MSVRKLLAYAAIYILWGGSFLAIREIVVVTPPFFAAGFRFLTAGLLLVLYSYLRGGVELNSRKFLSATALGFLMFTCLYALLFWAEVRLPSGIAAVVSAMIPIWIFVGEIFVLRTQRATAFSTAGILLGFGGVAILSLKSGTGQGTAEFLPTLATIAGTICWSVGTMWSRKLSLPKPQTANAGWQMAIGGFLLLVLSGAAGEYHRLPAAMAAWNLTIVLSMAYLIFAASILTFTSYVWLIAHEPAGKVASYAYVNPLIALLIGALLAGERLNVTQMIGAALVIAGVFATLTGKRTAPAVMEKTAA